MKENYLNSSILFHLKLTYFRSSSKELEATIRVEEEGVRITLVVTDYSLESIDLRKEKMVSSGRNQSVLGFCPFSQYNYGTSLL